jgi:hypothetical protein
MENPISSIFGNDESFGFNLEVTCNAKINSLVLSLSTTDHLHVSDILFLHDGKWIDLRTIQGLSTEQSTVEFFNDIPYSIGNWMNLAHRNNFFSTAFQHNPQVKFLLSIDMQIQGISIGNRIDGLWERAKTLKITIQTFCGKSVLIWDGSNPAYTIERLVMVALEINKQSLEFEKYFNFEGKSNIIIFDRLLSTSFKLIESPLLKSNQQDTLNILQEFFNYYLKCIEDGSESITFLDITAICKLNSLLDNTENEEVVISTVIFLLIKGKNLIAYNFIRRIITNNKNQINLKRLEKFTRKIGLLLFNYPLILTAHSFQRPLNSYVDIDLREFIRSVLSLLSEITDTVSMICYGTLLGAIREDDFIAHDDDIDLLFVIKKNHQTFNVIVERLVRLFEDNGFNVDLSLPNDEGALPFLQIKDINYPVHVDVFIGIQDNAEILMPMTIVKNELVNEALLLPVRYLDSGRFSGFPIPSNPDEFLKLRYGKDWITPDPLFRLNEN